MESAIRRRDSAEPSVVDEIRRALESRDIEAFANVFAEDAVLEEISSLTPPSHPRIVEGREAILKRLRADILHDPVGGWTREIDKSEIVDVVETADRVAFTEIRTYAAGDKVLAQHVAHKRGGKIARDRVVVAWDQGL